MTHERDAGQETILVIDDSAGNLALLHGILGSLYRVKVANNGTRGLAIAQAVPAPDLILLDMKMPDMDGLEACAALKAHPVSSGVPVIFLTGLADAEDEERGLAAGAVDYVVKPINAPVLLRRIDTHLQLSRAMRENAGWKAWAGAKRRDCEAVAQALDRFESVIVQEIRSSLGVIDGYATQARKRAEQDNDGQDASLLTPVCNGTQRLSTLVDRWHEVARQMRRPIAPELLNMTLLAREVLEELRSENRRGDEASFELADLPAIEADRLWMQQLLKQIIANALHFCPDARTPTVRIGANVAADEAVFSIDDNGRGIPERERQKVFAPLQRADGTEEAAGPGLGLFLAEQAIARHSGRIWIENSPLGGVGLRFALPLAQWQGASDLR